jgi:hypothetical protein
MSSRLDFDERRARALEGVVMYRPGAAAPLQPPAGGGRPDRGPAAPGHDAGPGDRDAQERRSRRRRRRGRRRPGDRGDDRQGSTGQAPDASIQQGFAGTGGTDAGSSEAPAADRSERAEFAGEREPSPES